MEALPVAQMVTGTGWPSAQMVSAAKGRAEYRRPHSEADCLAADGCWCTCVGCLNGHRYRDSDGQMQARVVVSPTPNG